VTNVKWYQVLVFSLVPLALAFAGIITGAHHGVDSQKEHFAAPPPPPPPSSSSSAAAPPAGGATLDLAAKNTAFDKRSLSAAANSPVTVRFNNQDAGVTHNVAFYKSKSSLTQPLAPGSKGNLLTGPASENITFTAPGPGTYYYQCDVHPDQMNGSFVVK
jgi:plastocyanin